MDGMQMMMKALGIDPAAIMQAASTFQEGLKKVMDDLETIKRNQDEILSYLRQPKEGSNAQLQVLSNGGYEATRLTNNG